MPFRRSAGQIFPLCFLIVAGDEGQKFLTVTFLGEQADWVVKAEISKARNQQFIFMHFLQVSCGSSPVNNLAC
ncbi:MAG: hypothetical protein D3904_01935 [Candidatus Electrothrix sp. EH2]|nr:hypothetical protein [Candidatus Electrothrix sp. EH2]